MFENLKNGWKLASETRKLIFGDKELLLYPILSALVTVLLAAAIFIPTFFSGLFNSWTVIFVVILFYVVVGFASTYILMALLVAFRSYTKGKRISMGEAFSIVRPYTKLILEWAIFYTILVMILRAIESRFGGIGRLLIGSIGSLAIATATLFAVPIILDKKVGPIAAVEESVKTIVHHFGNTFGGIVYSDLYGIAFFFLGVLVGIGFVFAGAVTGSIAVAIIGIVVIAIPLAVFGIIISYVTSNAFKLILYDYINGGALPKGFSKEMMESAAKQRKQGGRSGNMPDNSFA